MILYSSNDATVYLPNVSLRKLLLLFSRWQLTKMVATAAVCIVTGYEK